jgi:hypothetical protein
MMLKGAARWLLGREDRTVGCGVEGCSGKPTIAVAGTKSNITFMCVRHAIAWSESSLCRDYAQHNSGASPAALSAWLGVSQTCAKSLHISSESHAQSELRPADALCAV